MSTINIVLIREYMFLFYINFLSRLDVYHQQSGTGTMPDVPEQVKEKIRRDTAGRELHDP